MFLGVFVARGKEDALVTLNMVMGESVYGEKRITVGVGLISSVRKPQLYQWCSQPQMQL